MIFDERLNRELGVNDFAPVSDPNLCDECYFYTPFTCRRMEAFVNQLEKFYKKVCIKHEIIWKLKNIENNEHNSNQ
jgi:hypothetical protein